MVVPNQEQAALKFNALRDQLVQLNEGQRYAFNRDELVNLLDEARVRARGQNR